jgi:TPP-dependent 2-oxoacid decarboxylase
MNTRAVTNRNQAPTPPARPAGSDPAVTTVAGYLLARLAETGLISVFGVPGDDNLGVLDAITGRPSMAWIGMATEQGAAYAAESYARLRGLGAVVTTYGVGELSAMNAIAGAYAESVPVVHIVGTPALAARRLGATIHHNLPGSEYGHYACLASEFTAAQADLRADDAPGEIDRVVSAALRTSRPVYLAIPADVAGAPVPAPAARLAQARAIPARTDRPAPARTDRPAPTLTEMDPGHADHRGHLTQRRLWASVQRFLLPGDLVLADQGTASGPLMPKGAELIGPPPFAPIGWAVPAALGVSLAVPDRRVIVVTGGGVLQTAPELDSLLAQGTVPLIIVLNHDGDPVAAPNRHAVTLRASSPDELAWALNAANYHAAAGRPVLIEAVLAADDAWPRLAELAGALAGRESRP